MESDLQRSIRDLQHKLTVAEQQASAWEREVKELRTEAKVQREEIEAQTVTLGHLRHEYSATSDMLKESYKEVVRKLFRKPSLQSAMITVITSAVSIVISVAVTHYYSTGGIDNPAKVQVRRSAGLVARKTAKAREDAVTSKYTSNAICTTTIIDNMLAVDSLGQRSEYLKSADKEIARWKAGGFGGVNSWGSRTKIEDLECPYISMDYVLDQSSMAFLLVKHGIPSCVALEAQSNFIYWDWRRITAHQKWEKYLQSKINEEGKDAKPPQGSKTLQRFLPSGIVDNCGGIGWHNAETLDSLISNVQSNLEGARRQQELNANGYADQKPAAAQE
ncbi:hypothetical protein [Paraliomyxa miuraensis]|uniref:hypothetical protein n=1 Tax=Paraliomyxa miuraensis TaxID=376150 RepID=UPI002258884C|nr:hypothetical protein [Paraliomyxa miuraensis]MCX4240215.1 hypothetical protein [Paraliomyxa miuraensis]